MNEKQKKTRAVIRVVLTLIAAAIGGVIFAYRTGQPLYIKAAWACGGFLAAGAVLMVVCFVIDRKPETKV